MRQSTRLIALSALVALSLGAVSTTRADTIRGKITRIQPDSLSLILQVGGDRSVPVQATRTTRVAINGRAATFADLQVDDLAVIDGAPSNRGSFIAVAIQAHRGGDDSAHQVSGIVQDVSPDRRLLTLLTRRGVVAVHALDDARIVIDGEAARFGQIQSRDRARIVGRLDDQRVFQARSIAIHRRGDGQDDGGRDRNPDFGQWARGEVQRIDLNEHRYLLKMRRGSLIVQATDKTHVLDAAGHPIRFDQIQTGERTEVIGHLAPRRDNDRDSDLRVLVALRIQVLR